MSKLSNKNKQVKENKKRRNTKRKVGGANNTVSIEEQLKQLKKLIKDNLEKELLYQRALDPNVSNPPKIAAFKLNQEMIELNKQIDIIIGELRMSEEDIDKITKEALKGTGGQQNEIERRKKTLTGALTNKLQGARSALRAKDLAAPLTNAQREEARGGRTALW